MELANGPLLYEVGDQVAEAERYRLFLCQQKETGRQCLLQIASGAEFNGDLDRAAFILGELKRLASELETEYAAVKKDPKEMLNYDLQFPELLDSFICPEQGDRRINILAFKNVEEVSKMVPLINITEKDHLRVDLRTSAWIMGKLLKLLVFTHSNGILITSIDGNNILIEPDQHYVLIFDWSSAVTCTETVAVENQRQEIEAAAKAIIDVLGCNPETGILPDDGDAAFYPYGDFLSQLAQGNMRSAKKAHTRFYELIDSLWERKFYPFTTKPLTV
jgi:hypothetical protein